MNKIRGTHTSPGIYTEINDLNYAANTLGITTLGLVGETLEGPAFEPIEVKNWTQYQDYFGGTSAEKFKDTLYPKYELPYIAKSYLKASDQLYVCRVLGLSGYNAGPAFIIKAHSESDSKDYVVAVLRSRGKYRKYANLGNECNPISAYDTLEFDCDEIELEPYENISMVINACSGNTYDKISGETEFNVSLLNYGQFTIVAKKNGEPVGTYPVSLNAGAKDYIYAVLGGKASEGSSAVFVEELYDYKLQELVESGKVDSISGDVTIVAPIKINIVCDPVLDFVTMPYDSLKRKNLGQTFICNTTDNSFEENGFVYAECDKSGDLVKNDGAPSYKPMEIGYVYMVKAFINAESGKRSYVYAQLLDENKQAIHVTDIVDYTNEVTDAYPYEQKVDAVKVLKYDEIVYLNEGAKKADANPDETQEANVEEMHPIVSSLSTIVDMNDYKEQFRCATTPWIVSELKGDGNNLQVKKLFRFHTISDGDNANSLIKISVANIRPDDGTFDIYVRDFNDSDGNPIILETYKNLTMVPGDKKYIGLQIGTLNGDYESKSKYVLVEVIENDMTATCVPAGFLGYPVREYDDADSPSFTYNTNYDEDVRDRRQYFGLSDITGVDVDMLTYKGKNAYTENYSHGYTNGFHLDSTLTKDVVDGLGITVTVDGDEETKDMNWTTVNVNNVTIEGIAPVISSEFEMEGTIYENVALRKFTVYPCGGFDGWDVYRKARTNSDEYRANKYKGTITHGVGSTFSKIYNGDMLNLKGNAITSDYYAYLAGYKQFENPELHQINLFATPGIDYVNNLSLTSEVIEMLEDVRKDTFYVATTPDKPKGASDDVDEMYSSSDASANLDDSNIDTFYASSYYPWVKYFDGDNNIFINLPPTKDVLRNMADVDNKKYPWIAPAGIERGNVECVKTHFFAKLEDEDNVYSNRINPIKTFSKDGVKVWGDKTLYKGDTPMNRINTVRLVLYMRKLISESVRRLIFEPNDTTLKAEFRSIVEPILQNIKSERGIVDFRLDISQTVEEMDAHEMNCKLWVKPTPTLEYIGISFMVTPLGVSFED